ncbi:MAG: ABC transporter permease [Nitrospinota bacterium]|nr:MAG: ABC transporter permease [Nitrospinota bacterium]
MKLFAFITKRILYIFPTLLGLVILTFFLARVVPADPVAVIAGENATREQIEELRHRYGFDRPLYIQLVFYLKQLATGDLGESLYTGRDVITDILWRTPATIELTLAAMCIAIIVGIPLGVISALKRNSWLDHLLRIFTISGLSIAGFWLGIMLQLFFSMYLDIAPLGGRIGVDEPTYITGLYLLDSLLTWNWPAFFSALHHLFLPAITLAFPALATITRFTRSGVLDVIHRDFILYERSMGLPGFLIIAKYLLRNAVMSTVTQIGLLFGSLLAGAVVIETVYDWPGLGLYAVSAILTFDYKPVLGVTLWAGAVYTIVNLLIDIVQGIIDPRIREFA